MLSCRKGGYVPRLCYGRRLYSSKVRVFPFVVSKEQAIEDLSVNTAIYTGEKLLGTYLRRLLPSLPVNIDVLRPTRLQPAYIPAWYIDAQVQATLWLKSPVEESEFHKNDAEVQFAHTCMPGFVYPPLSETCLQTTELRRQEPAPWSEDMRRHDGDDVLCLPFTLSPFYLTEAARSLSMADATLDILRFEPSSLRETMMSAYPVLIPVYLAQFTVNTPVNGRRQDLVVTSFIEAARKKPRVFVELIPALEELYSLLGLIQKRGHPGIVVTGSPIENPPRFANVRSILATRSTLRHRQYLEQWINLALCHGGPLKQYYDRYFAKGKGSVDWEDVRIRPFTFKERAANVQWLESAENLFVLEKMFEQYMQTRKRETTAGQDGDPNSEPDKDVEKLLHQIDSVKKEREETKPEWLAQYEIQQRLLAEAPSSSAEARP